jgi:hypothetical protein
VRKSHLIPAFGTTDLVDGVIDHLNVSLTWGVALYVSGTRGFSVKGSAVMGRSNEKRLASEGKALSKSSVEPV